MPDLSKCVKVGNGDVYCWDRTKKTFVKIVTREETITRLITVDVPTAEVPAGIIERFMEMAEENEEAAYA